MPLSLSSNIFNKLASCIPVYVHKATSLSLSTVLHYVSLFSNSASIINPFTLFLLLSTDLSFSVPCPNIHLSYAVVISIVYPFLAFLPSLVSTSPLILHYCSVVLSSQLSPEWFLLHLEIHSRWGSNFSAFPIALGQGFPTVLARFFFHPPLLLLFIFPSPCLCSLYPLSLQLKSKEKP